MDFRKAKDVVKGIGKAAGKEIVREFAVAFNMDNKEKPEEEEGLTAPRQLYNKHGNYFADKPGLIPKKLRFPYGDWRHKLVIGATGAGKSTWAENYVVNCNHGCCFIDNAKGDSTRNILQALPQEKLDKTVVLDHSNKHKPLAVGNFNEPQDVFEASMITDQWINFFISNFGIEDKYRTRLLLQNACKSTFGLRQATILDVVQLIKNSEYRSHVLGKLSNRDYKDVIDYWNEFDEKSEGQRREYKSPVLNRTGILLNDPNLKTTLGQRPKEKLKYKKWMDEGYTVLINAPEKKLSSEAVRCITALHVLSFWQASLDRENVWEDKSRQFSLIADEPQSWLGKNERALDNIFSKARKNRLNMMCLIQSLEQLNRESSELLKVILDNEPDIIAFSNNKLIDYDFENLPDWNFVGLIDGDKFRVKAPAPPEAKRSKKEVDRLIKDNRERFNKSYRKVMNNIKRRFRTWQNESMSAKKSESPTNGLETSASRESQTETRKSSDSSTTIDW